MRNKRSISKLPKFKKIQTLSAIIRDALLTALGKSHLNSSIRPDRLSGFWRVFLKKTDQGEELGGNETPNAKEKDESQLI